MNDRLSGTDRLRQLLLAIRAVERKATQTGSPTLTISAVAREANVSPALIHNSYPTVAALIREKQGLSGQTRVGVEKHREEIRRVRVRMKTLREEVRSVRAKIAKIASINELLLIENARLTALVNSDDVLPLHAASRKQTPRQD